MGTRPLKNKTAICFLSNTASGEGLDGGSDIHYSLKIWPIIHLIKILGYSLK